MTNGPRRVVLITGASSGIGRATAELLAARATVSSVVSVQPQRHLRSRASRSCHSMFEMRLRSRPALKRCVAALAGSTC